jgi:putative transposase
MNYHHKDTVKVKSKEGDWVTKKLELLSYSVRDEIVSRLRDNIKGLSESKKNGNTIGRIRFKRQVNSVPLKIINTKYLDKGLLRFEKLVDKVKVNRTRTVHRYS